MSGPARAVVHATRIATPLGDLLGYAKDDALCFLGFSDGRDRPRAALERRFGPVELRDGSDPLELRRAFKAYFAGDYAALLAIPLDAGGTPFQRKVWAALRRIPAGRTASYAEVAKAVGEPRAVRAVGAANGRNPIAIVVPCHRVITSDGRLGGYGGGLERKRFLLEHERAKGLRGSAAQRSLFQAR